MKNKLLFLKISSMEKILNKYFSREYFLNISYFLKINGALIPNYLYTCLEQYFQH